MNKTNKLLLGITALAVAGGAASMALAHDLPEEAPPWAEDAHAALEAGDYDAWKAAEQARFDEMTTEENFNHIQTIHRLLSEGKFKEARQYAKDNDLKPPHGPGFKRGFKAGMHAGQDGNQPGPEGEQPPAGQSS